MKTPSLTFVLIFSLVTALAQQPDSASYYVAKGTEAAQQRLFAVAAGDFDRAIALDPKNARAYIGEGRADLEMRRIDAAQGSFSKAYELDPGNQDVIKALCDLYFDDHEFQKALDLVGKCTACSDADRIRGMSYYGLEDYANAERYLQQAVSSDPSDAQSVYTLGRTEIELEKEPAAITWYLKAISLAPDRSNWIYELGLLYYNADDYKNALKYFQDAAARGYARSSDFQENVGFAELYTGDVQDGLQIMNGLMAKRPNNTELIGNIAYALYQIRRYDDAFTYYQKLMDINPKDASSLYMIGMIFQKKGDTAKGQKICDRAIEMDPALARNRQKKEMPAGL